MPECQLVGEAFRRRELQGHLRDALHPVARLPRSVDVELGLALWAETEGAVSGGISLKVERMFALQQGNDPNGAQRQQCERGRGPHARDAMLLAVH